jgi:hypothetical protein
MSGSEGPDSAEFWGSSLPRNIGILVDLFVGVRSGIAWDWCRRDSTGRGESGNPWKMKKCTTVDSEQDLLRYTIQGEGRQFW